MDDDECTLCGGDGNAYYCPMCGEPKCQYCNAYCECDKDDSED